MKKFFEFGHVKKIGLLDHELLNMSTGQNGSSSSSTVVVHQMVVLAENEGQRVGSARSQRLRACLVA
jgi:hypothetical protein